MRNENSQLYLNNISTHAADVHSARGRRNYRRRRGYGSSNRSRGQASQVKIEHSNQKS